MRALVELALLAMSPDTAEQVVILLSVEDGEAIKLGRDFDRLCRSFALFLCCGTLVGPLDLAFPELRENMLRTLNTALVGELIERTSGGGVLVWLCSSTGKSPGSSAGRAGDGGSEYLDKGATDDFMHVFSSTDGK
jgi:hypothetical protein